MTHLPPAIPPDQEPRLAALERRLRVRFRDRRLLFHALVHRSALNERPDLQLSSNERLEFLGDAVLGVIVAEQLYTALPEASEGVLTVTQATLVRESTLANWARAVDLGQYLVVGRGEEISGARNRDRVLASAFEAVVGARYLDRGLQRTTELLLPFIAAERAETPDRTLVDAKSRLQQRSQGKRDALPHYRVVAMSGPQHSPTFTVEVEVAGRVVGRGTGRSKQVAEQSAAEAALAVWEAQAAGLANDPSGDGHAAADRG
jgi:ribonuclease III